MVPAVAGRLKLYADVPVGFRTVVVAPLAPPFARPSVPAATALTPRTGAEVPAGTPLDVVAFASTCPPLIFAKPNVPDDVIVPPANPLLVEIEVTVPAPLTVAQVGSAPAPCVCSSCPLAPGAWIPHPAAPRYKIEPRVLPIARSISEVNVAAVVVRMIRQCQGICFRMTSHEGHRVLK